MKTESSAMLPEPGWLHKLTGLFMNLRILALLLPLGLSACAQMPAFMTRSGTAGASAVQGAPATAKLPVQPLTPPILLNFLVAETALQRGDTKTATEVYLELAGYTRDPRIAQRATEVALHARQPGIALDAAKIWLKADPDSLAARQALSALFVGTGRLDEARPHMEKLLTSGGTNVGEAFMQLNNLLGRNADKAAAFRLINQLAEPYPRLPEARFAVSQAAWFSEQPDIAATEIKRALALRPDWEIAAVYYGRILQRKSMAESIGFFEEFLKKYPASNDARLNYARILVAEKDYVRAREQFQQLLMMNPTNADVALATGLLSVELRDYDVAETSLRKALDLNYRDPNMVRFYLAGIYEKNQKIPMAMEWYKLVTDGNQYIPAHSRYAVLLSGQGKMDEARKYLQELPVKDNQQRVQLIIAEAQLLRTTGEHRKVFHLLSDGLKKLPDVPELLYDRALAAEEIGKSDILEQDLRKLIKLKPDYAHAYNALGYSLTERNNRLPEALELIEKASKLSPEDPFIMDSLGWVHYRMGNLDEGINYLKRAFAMNPDPEIAAHLGEVLWVKGVKEEAREIWQTAVRDHPDNKTLIKVIKKFMP